MFRIRYTSRFKKDYKIIQKRKYDLDLLKSTIWLLIDNKSLPKKYNPHKLSGIYADCWECHIRPDWLLIWQVDEKNKEIWLVRTGTHSDLF
ncbi:MAG: type II toxin-antitoxin system YafQ family toxin [Prolixibacteraceae bacterium]